MVIMLSAFNFGLSLIHWIQTFYKILQGCYEQWLNNNSFSNSLRCQTRRSIIAVFIHNLFGNFSY